jgi:hypothetical protein
LGDTRGGKTNLCQGSVEGHAEPSVEACNVIHPIAFSKPVIACGDESASEPVSSPAPDTNFANEAERHVDEVGG